MASASEAAAIVRALCHFGRKGRKNELFNLWVTQRSLSAHAQGIRERISHLSLLKHKCVCVCACVNDRVQKQRLLFRKLVMQDHLF